jgi:hypothetical protein
MGRPPGKRPAPPGAGKILADNDSSEFVFETETYGSPAATSSLSNKKSLLDQRIERKSKGKKPPVPWWIWGSVGVGLLVVCYLTYKVLLKG